MSSRRPRVKVAANLNIRRAPKSSTGEQPKAPEVDKIVTITKDAVTDSTSVDETADTLIKHVPNENAFKEEEVLPKQDKQDEQYFKLPKPVDDIPKHYSSGAGLGVDSANISHPNPSNIASINNNNHDEPMSPRKQEARFGFPYPLSRKRNRTESLTSNKSLPEGIMVNKIARKVATKQEESQRTLENKKEARKRLTNIDNKNKQSLTMFDMIYYNPINNPMETPAMSKRGSVENLPKSIEDRKSRSVSKSRSPTPAPAPPTVPKVPVQLTPQLKLGPNGEMILDEASLIIENEREKEILETLANNDIVYQDEFSGNSGYYSRIRRTKDWTNEETIRFYRCLHTIGTDFSMMLTLFPCRTRRDLKLKFKKEERLNLQLINKALQHPKEFNLDELKQQFAREDEELERIREEQQQRAEEMREKLRQEKLNKKMMLGLAKGRNPKKRVSKSERAMIDSTEGNSELQSKANEATKPKRKRRKKLDPDFVQDNPTGLDEAECLTQPTDPAPVKDEYSTEIINTTETTSEPVDNLPVPAPEVSETPASESRKQQTKTNKSKKYRWKLWNRSKRKRTKPNINNPSHPTAKPVPSVPNEPKEVNPSRISSTNVGIICANGKAETDASSVDSESVISKHCINNALPLVSIPAAIPIQTTPVIVLESLNAQGTNVNTDAPPVSNQPCIINELTPVVIKYDDAAAELECLPLPKANAPEARIVHLAENDFCAIDNSRQTLTELEAPNKSRSMGPVGKQTVANTACSRPQLSTSTTEGSAAGNTAHPEIEDVRDNLSAEPVSVRHKVESDMDQLVPIRPKMASNDDDDEEYAADNSFEDECYVADEPIPEADDEHYCTKVEEPDGTNDGYLCETVAEISIGREEITAGSFSDLPKKEIAAGHPTAHSACNSEDTPKQEGKLEQVDLSKTDEAADAGPETDHSFGQATVEDDNDGAGFSLEDIDINSLVLVESQDTNEPNKTIYEIYVADPSTGQLSEKPLDVPADVIGNIRAILEAGDGGS